MAKTFRMNFFFNEKICTALVSLRPFDYDMSFMVRYIDSDIKSIIPGGKLKFHLSGLIDEPAVVHTDHGRKLLASTTEAITSYLYAMDIE